MMQSSSGTDTPMNNFVRKKIQSGPRDLMRASFMKHARAWSLSVLLRSRAEVRPERTLQV
jgi:hypothetical protein